MDIAVNRRPVLEREPRAPAPGRAGLARVEVFTDLVQAEPYWRRLDDGGALATPYQRFDLLEAWQRHVGSRAGVTPLLVAGFDSAGEPLFLWPFGRVRRGGLAVARFLGSKHANFNMGLWRRDFLADVTAEHLHEDFAEAARSAGGIDLAVLLSQPLSWDGAANPFALLPHQASVDISARQNLTGGGDALRGVLSSSMRARLRTKERKLERLPGYRYVLAESEADVERLLERFFALKSAHMAAQGLGNVFAEQGVAEFLRDACRRRLPDGRPLIEIHALEGGGEVLALFGTIADGYRLSSMFNTYTVGGNARHSPGLVLLCHIVGACAARGVRSFDLGVGRAHYKSFFCREPEPLFDTFLPLSGRGRVAAAAFAAAFAAKRGIKHSPALWSAVQLLRRLRAQG
jgi:CelD/BcsL family acetyltransferase involved in cellulose biosynthesis